PEVTELAFACIGAAMVLDVLTLIEEALASAVADGLLGKESAFTREHRRAGRLFLASAFMTYLAAFLSHLILLTYWSWLVELIGDGLFTEVAASPTGWRAVALGLATAILLAHAVLVVTRLLAPRQRTERPSLDRATSPSLTPSLSSILDDSSTVTWIGRLAQPSILVVIALVWSQSAELAHWWCVLLAFVPGLGAIRTLLSLPLALFYLALAMVLLRVRRRFSTVVDSPAYRRDRRRGRNHMRQGNWLLRQIVADHNRNPALSDRIARLTKLLFVPALVSYWLLI
ncbi:MAG: hypothetical protein AAGC55_27105, partial [Myxococcota bacterium]